MLRKHMEYKICKKGRWGMAAELEIRCMPHLFLSVPI